METKIVEQERKMNLLEKNVSIKTLIGLVIVVVCCYYAYTTVYAMGKASGVDEAYIKGVNEGFVLGGIKTNFQIMSNFVTQCVNTEATEVKLGCEDLKKGYQSAYIEATSAGLIKTENQTLPTVKINTKVTTPT